MKGTKSPPVPAPLVRAAIDSLADGVLFFDTNEEVQHINPAAEELLGRSRERTVGAPLRNLAGGAQLAMLAERARVTQSTAEAQFPSPLEPGMSITAEASPMFDGSSCVGTVIELRAPRGGRSLDFGALAAGLAHEIKNPLAGLQGAAELLVREADGRAREYAQVIAREAKRVDNLVRELLDLARPAALAAEPVNIHTVLSDVLLLARGFPTADRISFEEAYDPSIPPVLGDVEKLTQVVLNLVRNAVDAVSSTSEPKVIFHTSMSGMRVRIGNGRTRPLARVSILDNGPGIAEIIAPSLFTPFATSKAHGTGLGLAISRRIVEAHGGRIELKNRAGGGAEANLFLPLEVP
jgi:two-component system nitrogen regulation sensor histidine kinase GlnL